MDHIGEAANLLPILRARICGYTGIFRCVDSFWHKFPSPTYNYQNSFKETAKEDNTVNKYNCNTKQTADFSVEENNHGLAKGYGPKTIPANHTQLYPGTTSGMGTTPGTGTTRGMGTTPGMGTTLGTGTTPGITTIPEEEPIIVEDHPDPMPTQKTGFFASLFGSS